VHRDNFVSWQGGGLYKLIKSNVNAKLSHLTAEYPHAPSHVNVYGAFSQWKDGMRAFNYTQCCCILSRAAFNNSVFGLRMACSYPVVLCFRLGGYNSSCENPPRVHKSAKNMALALLTTNAHTRNDIAAIKQTFYATN